MGIELPFGGGSRPPQAEQVSPTQSAVSTEAVGGQQADVVTPSTSEALGSMVDPSTKDVVAGMSAQATSFVPGSKPGPISAAPTNVASQSSSEQKPAA